MKIKFTGLAIGSTLLCGQSARTSQIINEELQKNEILQKKTSQTLSTFSINSQVSYDDLSPDDKYKYNLKNFRVDENSVSRLNCLARDDNHEESQLYLAECYRTGVLGKYDETRAIEYCELALSKNQSVRAASLLAGIYWANGDFDQAKNYCGKTKELVKDQNSHNLDFINILLSKMNE